MSNCLQLDHVDYAYGAAKILVLSDVSADFESGKMYAITGPSGAGKSTLLSLLAGLDAPSRGVVRFEGEDIAASGYAKHRREHVSLVFQDHNLIDYLTPEENLRLVSTKADMKILEELGLSREESKRNIMHLSGGQRQRVAVGDPEMTDEVIHLLQHAAHQLGKCVIVVTHSKRVADSADVVLRLRSKKLARA
ncbi:MAG: ABC transporter ATP-binding protein [Bifidobacterium breve]|nr:ABC transporter ATP-binding protein [Bifidobacterium breve]